MINELTADQKAQLAVYRDKWIAIGLSTEPADRSEAESAIRHAYRVAGLCEPKRIVWTTSPLAQGLCHVILANDRVSVSVMTTVRASFSDSVWAGLGDSVRNSVMTSVRAGIMTGLGASVKNSVMTSVRDSVWAGLVDSVRNSVMTSVRAGMKNSVKAIVWASVGASVWDSGCGQCDANWLGFYEYLRDICGLEKQTDKLVPMITLAKHAGWLLPYEKTCFISERPCFLSTDERGRLHNENRMALEYPDGWGVYAWHGVRVPRFVIEKPDTITVEMILKEINSELKRVMIEVIGVDRFFQQIKGTLVHSDTDGYGNPRELLRFPMAQATRGYLQAVKVVCPTTGRVYHLGVPSSVRTCQEAVASTFGLKPGEYHPDRET